MCQLFLSPGDFVMHAAWSETNEIYKCTELLVSRTKSMSRDKMSFIPSRFKDRGFEYGKSEVVLIVEDCRS